MTSCQHGKRRRVRGRRISGHLSRLSSPLQQQARSKYKMTRFFFLCWCFFFLFCDGLRCCFEREKNNNVSTFCSRQLFLMRENPYQMPLFTRHLLRSKTHSSRDCFRIFYRIISSLSFLTHRRRKQNTFTQKKKKKKKNIKSSAKNMSTSCCNVSSSSSTRVVVEKTFPSSSPRDEDDG